MSDSHDNIEEQVVLDTPGAPEMVGAMTSRRRSKHLDRPIVIFGCPRSGTTLLSTMLHAHARIAIAPETRFVTSTYLGRERFGDLRKRANRRKLAKWITRPEARFRALGVDRQNVIDRIVDGPPTLGSAYAAVWEEYAAKRGKPRWGEKRPHYFQWTGMLLRLFPDAQFVGIIRDPRACVASLIAAPWWEGGFNSALTAWVISDWHMHRHARKAGKGRYFQLKFEDLVVRPRQQLTALCDFLHEDFDEAMLNHATVATDIVRESSTDHPLIHGAVDPSRIEAWRSSLSPEQVGLIELACKRAMRRHGYEPSGLGVRPARQLAMGFAKDLVSNQFRHVRTLWRDVKLRRREQQPLAAVKTRPQTEDPPAAVT